MYLAAQHSLLRTPPPLGQTLIVTAGSGWVQQWGGPVEEIRQGDAATKGMTHIAIQEQLDGKTADWMEKVIDEQCRR